MADASNLAYYSDLSPDKIADGPQADATIGCDCRGEQSAYTYTVLPRGGHFADAGQSAYKYSSASAQQYLTRLYDRVSPTLCQTFESSNLPSIQLQIRGIGKELYDQLISPRLQAYMRSLKRGATVNISSKDNWIPWEIIHDGRDFWGVRYNVRRLPLLPLMASPQGNTPKTRQSLASGHIKHGVNIIGNDLSSLEVQTAKTTFENFCKSHRLESRPVSDSPIAIHQLQELLKNVDVVHITCHGFADTSGHYLQLGPFQEHRLTIESVSQLSVNGGLVFANACSSAAPSYVLDDFVTFGWEFYEAGAEVFIGTLVPVPVTFALEFAQRFYRTWKPGRMGCGTALHKVKHQMSKSGNLFWLFYCQYGTP
jgi:hypothetical protein